MLKSLKIHFRALLPLAGFLLAAGCALKFELPVLPNLSLKDIPASTDANKVPNATPQTGQNKTVPAVIARLSIGDSVARDLVINKQGNCVQINELPDKSVVVDFSGKPCPALATTAILASDLLFRATYKRLSGNVYDLFLDQLNFGEMELSSDGSELTLTALCTGNYLCRQPVSANLLSGKPTNW